MENILKFLFIFLTLSLSAKAQFGIEDNLSVDDRTWSSFKVQTELDAVSGTLSDNLILIQQNASDIQVVSGSLNDHVFDFNNPHNVTKAQVGLGNADNTSDANKPISILTQAALDLKYDASNPQGFETPAELNGRDTANRDRSSHTGTQLTSTISNFDSSVQSNADVSQNTTHRGLTNNPHGTIASQVGAYTTAQTDTAISNAISTHEGALDPHPQYLTSGESDGLYYSILNPSGFETPAQLTLRDTANRQRGNHTGTQLSSTISDFDTRVEANTEVSTNTTHRDLINNPHSVTKGQVGLGNADNTSDANKPVSIATQTALDLKYDASNPNGYETPAQLNVRDTANRARANHTGVQPINTLTQFDTLLGGGNSDKYYSIQMNGAGTAYVTFEDFEDSRTATGLINQSTVLEDFMNEDFTIPAAGDYEITFAGAGSINATDNDLHLTFTVDGGAALKIYQKEGKDAGGGGPTFPVIGGGTAATGTDQLSNINYTGVFTLAAGTRNVAVQFRGTPFANDEAALHFGTIIIRRMKK